MKIKITYRYIVMRQHVSTTSTTLLYFRKINVTSALSRVESALHREDVTAIVGFQASKKGKSVDEYEISVTTTTWRLLSSQQLCRYHRWNGHDMTGRSLLCSTSSKSRSTPFPEPRNTFHMRQDAVPVGNITLSRTNVFAIATFIRSSHKKKMCAQTNKPDSMVRHGRPT